jgi:hypothetical protein
MTGELADRVRIFLGGTTMGRIRFDASRVFLIEAGHSDTTKPTERDARRS